MIDIETAAGTAKGEIAAIAELALAMKKDLECIADLAGGLDEKNWAEKAEAIFWTARQHLSPGLRANIFRKGD